MEDPYKQVSPENIEEIRKIVEKSCNIGVVSGGHSYCPVIADTIIDMSNFKSISIDTNKEIVKVGAGVTMKKLYLKLAKYGYVYPGGSCPTVAIGGLILGGGLSVLMRKYSIACDSLIDATVVLSNGSVVQAKDDEKLMWMLKGAGQGLCIAIDYTLKIYKLPPITYDFELILKDWLWAPKAIKLWQKFVDYPPDDNLWMQLIISYKSLKILGHYHGVTRMNSFDLPRKFLKLFDITIYPRINYVDSLNFWFGDTNNTNLKFNAISTVQYTKLCKRGVWDLVKIFSQPQPFTASVDIDLLGGKMREMNNTAFPHRNAFCTYQFITLAEEDYVDKADKWLIDVYNIMEPYTCGSYVSYCNPYTTPKMYFLQNLKQAKHGLKIYDPDNIIYKAYNI